jgi:hypothetical protein
MADLVQNPFDTQQPKPKNTGIIATAAQAPTQPHVQPAMDMPVQPAYVAEKPAVDKSTDTTSGQLTSLLAGDSPVLQRARAIAAQQANSRGLLNSSMAAEAGTAAMIDRAVPIANADANVYDTRARSNADAGNQALSLGANIAAQMNLQRGSQVFQAGESALDRSQQSGENALDRAERSELQALQQKFQSGEAALDRTQQSRLQELQQKFQGGESALDRAQQTALQQSQQQFQSGESALDRAERGELQRLQQQFQADQSSLDRTQQSRLQELQQKFQGEQAGLDRTQQSTLQQAQIDAQRSLQESQQAFQTVQAQLDRTQQTELTKLQASLQESLNNKSLAPTFAANVSSQTMAAMQSILANHELTPEARRGAIDNLLSVANQQLAWGSKFYNTQIPTMPTVTAPGLWVPPPGGPSIPENPIPGPVTVPPVLPGG